MAQGYNHELLKSDAQIVDEIERAIGEPLTYRRGAGHFTGNKSAANPRHRQNSGIF